MSRKLFVLQGESGCYSSLHQWPEAIYATRDEAEREAKARNDAEYAALAAKYPNAPEKSRWDSLYYPHDCFTVVECDFAGAEVGPSAAPTDWRTDQNVQWALVDVQHCVVAWADHAKGLELLDALCAAVSACSRPALPERQLDDHVSHYLSTTTEAGRINDAVREALTKLTAMLLDGESPTLAEQPAEKRMIFRGMFAGICEAIDEWRDREYPAFGERETP